MDLSPQVINEVEFSMARRGYDPDQVDEFLEKVAVAVGELTERLGEARERAVLAERRANEIERKGAQRVIEAGPVPESVSAQAEAELETLKRTLVLAQRTADAAMREAEEEAARLRADAEAAAAKLISAAEGDARAAHEGTRQALVEEISGLESERDGLHEAVRTLERYVDEQRLRLRGSITELQRILDDPARLKATPPPVPIEEPAPAAPAAREPEAEPEIELEAEPKPKPKAKAKPAARVERPRPFVAESDDDDDSFEGLGLDLDDADDDAWARFSAPDDDIDAGPPTEPVLRLDDLARAADDDDAYLAELRKAMLEDTGAPDLDDSVLLDDAEDRPARTRFGRRR
jgi:cell division initiation protein